MKSGSSGHGIGLLLASLPSILDIQGLRSLHGATGSQGDLSSFLRRCVEEGHLIRVNGDLYLNERAHRRAEFDQVARHFYPDAVIGLHTVLGELGVAHNPSAVVTSTVPSDEVSDLPVVSDWMRFRFIPLPPAIQFAGEEDDRLAGGFSYPRATGEKAFCDYVFLASEAGGRRFPSPPLDMELDGLDMRRVDRLAIAMGVKDDLNVWVERHRTAWGDVEFAEKFSLKLGF